MASGARGALTAAAIILVVMRTAGPDAGAPARPSVQVRAAETATKSSMSGDDNGEGQTSALGGLPPAAGSLLPGGAMDDSLKELDVDQLWALRAGLERTLATTFARGSAGDADEPAESNPTALSDELEELDDAGLAMLSQNLEKI